MHIAFLMYIFTIAGASWLTAISINMTAGFRLLQGRRAGGRRERRRERRRFLWLCAGAWGLTLVFSAATITTFLATARPQYYKNWNAIKNINVNYVGPWYLPSFMETRTCFGDLKHVQGENTFDTTKLGSLLFYFGPVSALMVANVVCLSVTARRVHFLRRGNSLLQRDGQEGGGGRALTQAQSILVYVKLLLSAGAVETATEIVTWAISQSNGRLNVNRVAYWDHTYVYRTVGCFCDLLRALCVLWLAAPGVQEQMATLWKRLVARSRRSSKNK